MDFRQRHDDLLQKVRTGEAMTKDEMTELERLGKALADVDRQVAQDPEVIRQRKELTEKAARVQQDLVWTHIFRTNVAGFGHPDDTVGNRQIIWGWLDEARGDVFSVDWFAKVISEQPKLAQQLSWTIPLSAKERKAQAEKTAHAARQRALELCRQHSVSECESNLHILMNRDGDVISVASGTSLWTDEGEIPLVAASQAELQKYAQEKQEAHQNYLRELSAKGDIAGLRRAAAAERAEKTVASE